jgi:hypothetical protein
VTPVGWLVAVASAEAPDDSVEDMSMLLVESACQSGGADEVPTGVRESLSDGGNREVTLL